MPNDPKNLLDNLCNGLQKFLGFNAESKGYDGTGIVYSDLDRLCDAVMGFLSGVLGAVKNENEVTTYDTNNGLSSVLKKLEDSIGSGREGLAASVDAVKGWLEGYEREVGKKSNLVTTPIQSIKTDIQTHIEDAATPKKSIAEQINDWTTRADEYIAQAKKADKALKEIDSKLKDKLKCPINMLLQARKTFREDAGNRDLEELNKTAAAELANLKTLLEGEVAARVNEMATNIDNAFEEKIHGPLKKINSELGQVKDALEGWISKAKEVVKAAVRKCNTIIKKLDGTTGKDNPEKRKAVEIAAEGLRAKAQTLFDAAKAARDGIDGWVKNATGKITDLDVALRTDLFAVKNAIKDTMWKHVEDTIVPQFQRIRDKVGKEKEPSNNDKESIDYNWTTIKKEITDNVKLITGENVTAGIINIKYGIKHIYEGIKKYAENFDKKNSGDDDLTFDEIVQDWILDILNENQLVKDSIKDYVTGDNDGKIEETYTRTTVGDGYSELNTKIAGIMKEQLTVHGIERGGVLVQPLIEKAEAADDDKIEQYLSAVRSACDTLARELGNELKGSGGNGQLAGQISKKINEAVKMSSGDEPVRTHLITALQLILDQLMGIAIGVSAELKRFIDQSDLDGNLSHISSKVNQIGKQLQHGHPGHKIDTALGTVKQAIVDLDSVFIDQTFKNAVGAQVLDIEIGKDKNNTIGDLKKLTKYNDQNKDAKGSRDTLKKAIEKIKNDVEGTINWATIGIKPDHTGRVLQAELQLVSTELGKFADAVKGLLQNDGGRAGNIVDVNRGVNNLLDDLQTLIGGNGKGNMYGLKHQLDKISNDLIGIIGDDSKKDNTLSRLLDDSGKFLTETIPTQANRLIEEFNRYITGEIERTTNNIRTKARSLYSARKKKELTAFESIVNAEISEIQNIVDKDRARGIKCLLWYMNHSHENLFQVTGMGELKWASDKFKDYLGVLLQYVKEQVNIPGQHEEATTLSKQVRDLQKNVHDLLGFLAASKHFDHQFTDNLHSLHTALSAFTPTKFGERSSLILQAFKDGISGLAKELGRAYVNRYSGGEKFDGELVITPQRSVTSDKSETIYTLTDEGRKGAKILLTLFSTLNDSWLKLRNVCMNNVGNQINLRNGRLGAFLRIRGYDVASGENTQDGELQNKPGIDGNKLNELCMKDVRVSSRNLLQLFQKTNMTANNSINLDKLISFIHDSLVTYREVCHLRDIGSLKQPCSIYEMLIWTTGLPHNPVYPSLPFDGFSELFEKPEETEAEKIDESGPTVENIGDVFLPAYPKNITVESISGALTNVCHHSYNVLTAILGHGHSSGIYACDFSTNEHKFSYPSDVGKCIDMLIDISYRLYEQLFFLYTQCCNDDSCGGWIDCWYGQGIAGSSWNCNKLQCPNQAGNQMGNQSNNQIANQTCGQTCDQHPKCGLKSPLQSFLEDGLKGFLPHHLTKVGCGVRCSVTNHRGMPCKTPMGFVDISVAASRMSRGKRIKDLLEYYCGKPDSPLALICKYFRCLLQRPPQTLGEMFSFYHHLTDRWGMSGNDHKSNAFNATVRAANFGRDYGKLNVYHLFSASHSALKKGHSDGSLGSLVCLSKEAVVCGPYLRPISHSIYETFSSKHADKYLSWVVYLTASFYDLLKKLYDECNSKCGSRGSNCHGKSCVKECPTTSKQDPPRYHDRNCKSIVSCNSTLPTLAKYGFVLGNPERLNGSQGIEKKRTCRDFCNVFAEAFEKDSHLVQFFKAIDKFLFTIRAPFLWMTVALWSLSLFYLICVMVGRLDVLHIRSHLRIPSSHKITAQSLLAAAQVGRLAKISYLQP